VSLSGSTDVRTVILARGRGRRMRDSGPIPSLTPAQQEAARAGRKALMPVAGRPFLDFTLSALADAGCTNVALVIGPEQRSSFEAYLRSRANWRTQATLLVQIEASGTADAVLAAADFIDDLPFLVVNGDNLYPVGMLRDLKMLDGPGLAVFDAQQLVETSNIPPERIAEFATVELTATGELASIVEKPGQQAEATRLVSMNAWKFDRRILDACRDVPRSIRGEFELPEAVALAVSRGVRFTAVRACGGVLDLSRPADIPEVTQRLAGLDPHP
jgi:dTDP-glucose pyrophosphorylase